MKILTTTFYADFVRYFNYLEDELEKLVQDIEFYNISLYPTAHYQWKQYNRHSILLPNAVLNYKNKISIIPDEYKGINLSKIINFSYKTQIMFNKDNTNELKIQAIRYIDFFEELFNDKFDLYISSGDSRMLIQIADIFAKRNNVKTYYFEQGPFGTTILDEKGVNYNISFRDRKNLNENIVKEKVQIFIDNYYTNKPRNYWASRKKTFTRRVVNLHNTLWMYPPTLLSNFFPVDTQVGISFWNHIKKVFSNRLDKSNLDSSLPKKYIAFIMQMPTDAQLIENSPLYANFDSMISDIYQSLPNGYSLVVREHPGFKGKYSSFLYEFINKNENIYLKNSASLLDTIKNAQLLILNNSTVGIEALFYHKTVITLGNAYYNKEGVIYSLKSRSELKGLVQYALNNPIKEDIIDVFLYNFIFDYLYMGHFRDENLQSGDLIAKELLESISK
ncbi:hypothetical protein HOK00_01600 [bacterium]|jgi:capsular polysaccharide export protein|nr:hypothetical protein [bacterium]